jgi:hypothetical protein
VQTRTRDANVLHNPRPMPQLTDTNEWQPAAVRTPPSRSLLPLFHFVIPPYPGSFPNHGGDHIQSISHFLLALNSIRELHRPYWISREILTSLSWTTSSPRSTLVPVERKSVTGFSSCASSMPDRVFLSVLAFSNN